MNNRKKVLLIGGSVNQTKIIHAVGKELEEKYDCYYSPAYCEGLLNVARQSGMLEFTVLGERIRKRSEEYLNDHHLPIDYGATHSYDLFVTTSDIIIQKKLLRKPVVLVQEGMVDPEDWRYHVVRALHLPRWMAGTAMAGLSHVYRYFCVASPGYRKALIEKGCNPDKVIVTGLPNFDHVRSFCNNDFPFHDYVLVATSNARETFKADDRFRFLHWAMERAQGRPTIFKLHPNENVERATREIKTVAPEALIFSSGDTDHMIANCSTLITQYSTCIFVGLALGKECHSYFDVEKLRNLMPIQNNGQSGRRIAFVCNRVLQQPIPSFSPAKKQPAWLAEWEGQK
jgi:hypothetical protein